METRAFNPPPIRINTQISALFPNMVIGWLLADVQNGESHPELTGLLEDKALQIYRTMDEESIRQVPGIKAGKAAYRQLGKDPNRYRLSAEALMRRAAKGKELNSISTAVDGLNLVSLETGITIGGFDAGRIDGEIVLGIGYPREEFIAIGRGPLNVENLPVYRDQAGAIGSPTSDSERTRITLSTQIVLMLITDFYGNGNIDQVISRLGILLTRFSHSTHPASGFISYQVEND